MTTTQTDNQRITETHLSYDQCRRAYGTADVRELNARLQPNQWAIYSKGLILIVTEG